MGVVKRSTLPIGENMKVEAGRPGWGGGDGLARREVQVGRWDEKRVWEQRVDGDL